MMKIIKTLAIACAFVFVFFGFAGTTHALTQSDVDVICIIFDCDEAGIRSALDALVDDESTEITRNLFPGISGDDVSTLQAFLAEDATIYPEGLVTGFYGPLTQSAVVRFQSRFGIDPVGTVGPITRSTINKFFQEDEDLIAVYIKKADLDDDDDIDDSEFGPGDTGVLVCHIPSGNLSAAHTIAVGGPAVQAHLNHGDTLGACDDDGDDDDDDNDDGDDDDDDNDDGDDDDDNDDGDDDDDDDEPEISDVEVEVGATTATITWETDVKADSEVVYMVEGGDDEESEDDNDDVRSHRIVLEDLDSDTTYEYHVESTDKKGNTAISDTFEFTTL